MRTETEVQVKSLCSWDLKLQVNYLITETYVKLISAELNSKNRNIFSEVKYHCRNPAHPVC